MAVSKKLVRATGVDKSGEVGGDIFLGSFRELPVEHFSGAKRLSRVSYDWPKAFHVWMTPTIIDKLLAPFAYKAAGKAALLL